MAYWPEANNSTLRGDEFDKRCHDVFIDDDETKVIYCGIINHRDGWATVYGAEFFGPEDPRYYPCSFSHEVNMTERPQALGYLLGKRDDFND